MHELYDHALEKSVLGILSNVSALDASKARDDIETTGLRTGSFHHEAHRAIFDATSTVLKHGNPADPFTVQAELLRKESFVSQDMKLLSDILTGQPHLNEFSLPAYAKDLNELALRRNIFSLLSQAKEKIVSKSSNIEELMDSLSMRLVETDIGSTKIVTLSDLMRNIAVQLDEVESGKSEPVIPTGIGALDNVIGGLQPTLIIVGALPGVGKSALVSTLAHNLAKDGKRIGIISLEDEASWLPWRIFSREAGVEQFILRFRKLNEFQKVSAMEAYSLMEKFGDNILMADGSDHPMEIEQVSRACHEMILKYGVKAIIVDHLGEIAYSGAGERYDLEVSRHLSRLRAIANRFQVPVIVALHLKRREGLGPGDKPTITDFANSSGSERKARVALALSRGEGHDEMQIHILKNTHGKGVGGTVRVQFHGPSAMLKSVEESTYDVRRKREKPDSASSKGQLERIGFKESGPFEADQGSPNRDDAGVEEHIRRQVGVQPSFRDDGPDKEGLPWD